MIKSRFVPKKVPDGNRVIDRRVERRIVIIITYSDYDGYALPKNGLAKQSVDRLRDFGRLTASDILFRYTGFRNSTEKETKYKNTGCENP